MAMHSSILDWKIPWLEEPGGLQSMGLQRVGHDWVTSLLLSLFTFTFELEKYESEIEKVPFVIGSATIKTGNKILGNKSIEKT